MLREIHERVASVCGVEVTSRATPHLTSIIKNSGFVQSGQSTGILFADSQSRHPDFVYKISHHPSQDHRIFTEFENLRALHGCGSEFLARSVPQPVGLERIRERPLLVLRAHPTARRLKDLNPRRYLSLSRVGDCLQEAGDWLGGFAEEMSPSRIQLDDGSLQRLRRPIETYLQVFKTSRWEADLLRDHLECLESLVGLELPLVPSHGDFCPANLLSSPEGWIVIDWELPLTPALPLRDHFHFLASLDYVKASGSMRGNRGKNFSVAFLSSGPYRRLLDRFLEESRVRIGVPLECMDALFFAFWADAAVEKIEYLRSMGWDPFDEENGDFDEFTPIIRLRAGSCENVRDSLARCRRLPWRTKLASPAWGGCPMPVLDGARLERAMRPRVEFQWVPVRHRQDEDRKETYLVFETGSRRPSFVANVSSSKDGLECKARRLEELARCADVAFLETIPEMRGLFELKEEGRWLLLETVVPGQPLSAQLSRLRGGPFLKEVLSSLTDWLLNFHEVTGVCWTRQPELSQRWGSFLERFEQRFELSRESRNCFEKIRGVLDDPRLDSIPLVELHGDVCPANVLWDRRGVRLIDWEMVWSRDFPQSDLLHFLSSCALATTSGDEEYLRRMESHLFGKGARRVLRDCLRRYQERFALPGEFLEILPQLAWIEGAVLKAEYADKTGKSSGFCDYVALDGRTCLNLEWFANRSWS